MTPADLLASRVAVLREIVRESFKDSNDQSQGFALRILGLESTKQVLPEPEFKLAPAIESAHYGGFPTAAYLGYGLGQGGNSLSNSVQQTFRWMANRLRLRVDDHRREFAADDAAVLGVSDGLAALSPDAEVLELRNWLVTLVAQERAADAWSLRLQALTAELLDQRGRLQTRVANDDHLTLALDLCLRHRWPHVYERVPVPERTVQQTLMSVLLTEPAPEVGDLERAVVWLKALELLAAQAAVLLVPSVSDTARLLRSTQSALKRWVWDEKARRPDADPGRWLIDNEYHVQSFLWAVLYPIFGENLQDETYLQGYGLVQPRTDFCVLNLKLIIEVKVLRSKKDFKAVEEQIAGDLGLYFVDPNRFNRLIAYIYDDCDTQHPELYEVLRSALRNRDTRIEDVVIIRRPSMIPARSARKTEVVEAPPPAVSPSKVKGRGSSKPKETPQKKEPSSKSVSGSAH